MRGLDKVKELSELLTQLENGKEYDLSAFLSSRKQPFVIGVTGPSGSGKSTLISKLAKIFLNKRVKVGVLANDPTSYVSKGSLLGDRIRMTELNAFEGAYVRSVPSRGRRGGLNYFIVEMIYAMFNFGYKVIFLETTGVGQDEVEIHYVSDIVLNVSVPSLGDEIQFIKAGVNEITDIFVVNKIDSFKNYELYVSELMIALKENKWGWTPKIVPVSAVQNTNIDLLYKYILEYKSIYRKKIRETLVNRFRFVLYSRVEKALDERLDSIDFRSLFDEYIKDKSLNEALKKLILKIYEQV